MYKSAGGLTSCTGLHAHYETKPTPDADCVSAFPFLTDDEFHLGCRAIEHGSHYTIRSTEPLTLSTTKTFNLGRDVEPWGEDDDVQCQEEADEEGLRDPRQDSSSVTVRFDIILSPSYRVPVVYITPSASANASRIPTMCEVRDLVVPHSYSSALEGAGVIGALSATDHPLTGLPSYFVHPCRTADALLACSESRQVSAKVYMMVWFGIVGAHVGLSIPMEQALSALEPVEGGPSGELRKPECARCV